MGSSTFDPKPQKQNLAFWPRATVQNFIKIE